MKYLYKLPSYVIKINIIILMLKFFDIINISWFQSFLPIIVLYGGVIIFFIGFIIWFYYQGKNMNDLDRQHF